MLPAPDVRVQLRSETHVSSVGSESNAPPSASQNAVGSDDAQVSVHSQTLPLMSETPGKAPTQAGNESTRESMVFEQAFASNVLPYG
jgi:hypothetical protein